MSEEIEGGCLCGGVRYRLRKMPKTISVRHGAHCQKSSGSAFSVNLIAPQTDLAIDGEMRLFEDQADSGDILRRYFCPRCGAPIGARNATRPGMFILRAGTLDNPRRIDHIGLQCWTRSRQPWLMLAVETPEFEKASKV